MLILNKLPTHIYTHTHITHTHITHTHITHIIQREKEIEKETKKERSKDLNNASASVFLVFLCSRLKRH